MCKKWKFENSVFQKVIRPFKIIRMHRAAFIVWTILTLFGGLVGVLANIFRNAGFGESSIIEAIGFEANNGSLYTYSIAIIASVLSSLFVHFEEKERLNYRYLQIPTAAISIFVLLFGGIFYAFNFNIDVQSRGFDWMQFIILILSITISIYVFCLSRLDDHDSDFKDISDQRYTKNNEISLPDNLTNEGVDKDKNEEGE